GFPRSSRSFGMSGNESSVTRQIKAGHRGRLKKELTSASFRRVPVVVFRRVELELPARRLVDLGSAQRGNPFLPLLDGAPADADSLRHLCLGAEISNHIGSTHDARVSLLARTVKYASLRGHLRDVDRL